MSFSFPCYRALKNQLGALDAIVECLELAVRHFEASAAGERSIDTFVTKMSKTYGIRVDTVDPTNMRLHAGHLYVTGVHQAFEEFLLELKSIHPNGKTWDFSSEADRLTKTVNAIGAKKTLAFDICQHYRQIRNAFSHPEVRSKLPPGDIDCSPLRERVKEEPAIASLDAPNGYFVTNFDDFILFTRSAKTLASELCIQGRPEDLFLANAALNQAKMSGIHGRLANHPGRLAKAMAGILQTEYSLDADEAGRIIKLVG